MTRVARNTVKKTTMKRQLNADLARCFRMNCWYGVLLSIYLSSRSEELASKTDSHWDPINNEVCYIAQVHRVHMFLSTASCCDDCVAVCHASHASTLLLLTYATLRSFMTHGRK